MKQFKALVIKEFLVNKKQMLIPFWITAGFYILMLGSMAYAALRGELNFAIQTSDPRVYEAMQNITKMNWLVFIVNVGALILPGFLYLVNCAAMPQGMMNDDRRQKCEIFHRSQPLSVWKITGAKYFLNYFGNLTVCIAIALFNFIVVNTVMAFYIKFNLLFAILGLTMGLIALLVMLLPLAAITFFFSSIFKEKALLKGFLIFIAIDIFIQIFNGLYGWHIPSLSEALTKFVNPFISIGGGQNLSMQCDERTFMGVNTPEMDIQINNTFWQIIKEFWLSLVSFKMFIKLAITAMLLYFSTVLYKDREVQ